MRALYRFAVVLLLFSLAPHADADPTYEEVSTRGEMVDPDSGDDADSAHWSGDPPVPDLPPSFAGPDCPESVVIYVHGFQNTEADAQANFAQAAKGLADAGYGGTVIGFSWDSDTGSSDFDSARESANLNGKVLADLIKRMKAKCPDAKINLISHSLGARVILMALKCGGCGHSVQLIAPAVDEDVLSKGEEFGSEEVAHNAGGDLKVWFNDEDDVLGAYPYEEGDAALGEDGPVDPDCLRAGVGSCDAQPKVIAGAKEGGKSPGVDNPDDDAEDDHSGYLYGKELMKCVAKRLK